MATRRKRPEPEVTPEVSPQAAGLRTTAQVGGFASLLALLTAFHVIDLTAEQTSALLVVGGGLTSWLMRLIEARLGRGFLRDVPR